MTEPYTETITGNAFTPYDYPLLTAELVLNSIDTAIEHGSEAVIRNLPSTGESVTITNVNEFYPKLVCSNSRRTYTELLDALAEILGGVRLQAVFRDREGKPFIHSRVQTSDGVPYYGRQKGVSSGRDSYLYLPAGKPAQDQPLVVCEGEKAAAAALSCGFASACWSGGSGIARTINVDEVEGVDVVLFPDNDHDGIRAMRALGDRMDGLARSVRIADFEGMPDRADIADIAPAEARRRIETSRGYAYFLSTTGGPIRKNAPKPRAKLSSELRRLAHVMAFYSATFRDDFLSELKYEEVGFANLVLENQAEKLLAVTEDGVVEFLVLRRNGIWSRDIKDLHRLIAIVGKHYLRRMVLSSIRVECQAGSA